MLRDSKISVAAGQETPCCAQLHSHALSESKREISSLPVTSPAWQIDMLLLNKAGTRKITQEVGWHLLNRV